MSSFVHLAGGNIRPPGKAEPELVSGSVLLLRQPFMIFADEEEEEDFGPCSELLNLLFKNFSLF